MVISPDPRRDPRNNHTPVSIREFLTDPPMDLGFFFRVPRSAPIGGFFPMSAKYELKRTSDRQTGRGSDHGERGGTAMTRHRRDTHKYVFKIGNKIVHGGITDDLVRREEEHQQKWPKGHIKSVGRRTTEDAARKWEEENGYS